MMFKYFHDTPNIIEKKKKCRNLAMLSMFTKEATTLYRMIGGSMPQDNDVPKFSRGVST